MRAWRLVYGIAALVVCAMLALVLWLQHGGPMR